MLGAGMQRQLKYKHDFALLSRARFPEKLHRAACDDDIVFIFWSTKGDALYIHANDFEAKVLEECPGLVRVESFKNLRRQFRVYGFTIKLCSGSWFQKVNMELSSYITEKWPGVMRNFNLYEMRHPHFLRDDIHQLHNVTSSSAVRKDIQFKVDCGAILPVQQTPTLVCSSVPQLLEERCLSKTSSTGESRKRKYSPDGIEKNGNYMESIRNNNNVNAMYESIVRPVRFDTAYPFQRYVQHDTSTVPTQMFEAYAGVHGQQIPGIPLNQWQQWQHAFDVLKQNNCCRVLSNQNLTGNQFIDVSQPLHNKQPFIIPVSANAERNPPFVSASSSAITSKAGTCSMIAPIWQTSAMTPIISSQSNIPSLFPRLQNELNQFTPINVIPQIAHCPPSYSNAQITPQLYMDAADTGANWQQEYALDFSTNMNPLSSSTPVKHNKEQALDSPVLNSGKCHQNIEVDQEVPKIELKRVNVDDNNNEAIYQNVPGIKTQYPRLVCVDSHNCQYREGGSSQSSE